jgi:hypothetical protein
MDRTVLHDCLHAKCCLLMCLQADGTFWYLVCRCLTPVPLLLNGTVDVFSSLLHLQVIGLHTGVPCPLDSSP